MGIKILISNGLLRKQNGKGRERHRMPENIFPKHVSNPKSGNRKQQKYSHLPTCLTEI
jgi:hypothetical protein